MMTFINFIRNIGMSIGKARAATHFSRIGRNDLARKIMTE